LSLHLAVDEVVIGEGHLKGYSDGHVNVLVVIGVVVVALRLPLEQLNPTEQQQ
jgi:hypothetical protein